MHSFRIIQRYRFPLSSKAWQSFFSGLYRDFVTLAGESEIAETAVETATETQYDTYVGSTHAALDVQLAAQTIRFYNTEA